MDRASSPRHGHRLSPQRREGTWRVRIGRLHHGTATGLSPRAGSSAEFLLGAALLVAPVLDAGVVTVRAYLPRNDYDDDDDARPAAARGGGSGDAGGDAGCGAWVHVWSNTTFPGCAFAEVRHGVPHQECHP